MILPDGRSRRLRPTDGPPLRSQERIYELTASARRPDRRPATES